MGKERISSGLPGLDRVLDDLLAGDNVVWSVGEFGHYAEFARCFAGRAIRDRRRLCYMRFASHRPLLDPAPGLKVYDLDAFIGFEPFTRRIHEIIGSEGEGVFYVFDCLSDLLSAWATDLMIGNFFRVTCPYLYELDTVAYFGLYRDCHSFKTIARIRETTQILIEVRRFESSCQVQPVKVDGRYSPTMFLPHIRRDGEFEPVTDSFRATEILSDEFRRMAGSGSRHLDHWDRLFLSAEQINRSGGEVERREMVDELCRVMIAREERMLGLARRFFGLDDLLDVKSRMIGTGFIGGKSLGMLLGRRILLSEPSSDWSERLENHDSFFVGSDVFYWYLVHNGLWRLLMKQKTEEGYFGVADELRKAMAEGEFPEEVREEFRQMIEYFGQYPIIVRSSSLLEDAFGNAFAGKYDSFFLVNRGTTEERLDRFENAVREIFACTMSENALAYRKSRGLDRSEEQMALLVQRVSGSYRGEYYFPDLAGVGVSYNTFVWRHDIDPRAGMLRLVVGLGTRAVDRVEGDYPRIAALDQPLLRPMKGPEDLRRFSQRDVDVLHLRENDLRTVPASSLLNRDLGLPLDLFCSRDHESERRMEERGLKVEPSLVVTLDNLFSCTGFTDTMRRMLKTLEAGYGYPVDIEFTVNFRPGSGERINLVQCRPLQTRGLGKAVRVPRDVDPEREFFRSEGCFMGGNLMQPLDRVVWVDPAAYSGLPLSSRYEVARLVGALNRGLGGRENCPAILLGPGRWGTTTPSLGVPVSFSEIDRFAVLAEVAFEGDAMNPELSFGTHFFQDLVETGIFYLALYPGNGNCRLNLDWLGSLPNMLEELAPDFPEHGDVVRVCDVSKEGLTLAADILSQRVLCWRETAACSGRDRRGTGPDLP